MSTLYVSSRNLHNHRKKIYFQTAPTPRAVVETVSGLALSFTEAEILDSGDPGKKRLNDTTKYRQLYTV